MAADKTSLWFRALDLKFFLTLQDKTLHWIGAQFGVWRFLESGDKFLNKLKLCRNDQREWKKIKRRAEERPCCGIRSKL